MNTYTFNVSMSENVYLGNFFFTKSEISFCHRVDMMSNSPIKRNIMNIFYYVRNFMTTKDLSIYFSVL